jgi:hypothetical protein
LISLCAALVVFAVVVIKARIPIPQPILGADAVAASASGTLSILSSKRIFQHDRAGNETGEISLTALGFAAVEPILAYTPGNNLLIREAKAADTQIGAQEDPLWRCDLETSKCVSVSGNLQGIEVSAFTPHELDGSLFVADASSKELLRINPEGEVISRAAINMPGKPVLNLQSGLLFMNSAEGPAVSVFRYEAQAFGKQLDEVLLLPPSAVNAQHTRVWDFVYNKDHWWVVMYDPDSGNAGIYRFDSQWNFQNQLPVATTTLPLQLIRWGEKVLVNTKRSSSLQRFNSEGIAEAPLESKALSKRIADTEQRARLLGKGTKLALTLAFGALIVALALLYLQRTRALVYKSQNERGAEPVDEHADNLDWIAPAKDRTRTLKQRLVSYTLLIVATAFLGISAELPSNTLVALLAFLAGPGCALGIMLRRPIGHIGTLTPRLLLVDPAGTYHLGGGSQLQYRGNFLLLNDVVVFTGNSIFPAFAREQVKQLVLPMTKGGVKIDWKTLLIKLLESRHPVALAGLSVLASWGIAVIALLALA